jgi:hypothetical protein
VAPAPRVRRRPRFLAGEQVVEADWVIPGGKLEHPVEDPAAVERAAAVEPEDELIEVGRQVSLADRALVGAQQPPLGQ